MQQITINGKIYPIKFGISTINKIAKESNKEFGEVLNFGENQLLEMCVTVLRVGLNAVDVNKQFSTEDVWDMIDEDPGVIFRAMELFTEAITPILDKLNTASENFQKPTPKPSNP